MAVELEAIQGLIELKDEFTGKLGLAEAALEQFSKENQASLGAVAVAAGVVTTALAATAAAAVELGKRGSAVNDVDETLKHFSGSAEAAAANMAELQKGTKGTVDNFELAKDAAHLLSAGVKLTAEDFGTLGQAAFVLQNRGLGGTKEQLDLVSDALVTGRTRALSMALGVVDVGDAEEKYAKQLGVTKDQLSDAGKVEAKRIEILSILNRAVKDAGTQNRDFGEQLEALHAGFTNFIDDVASAVAKSPVLAAGMKEAGAAIAAAFGPDNKTAITSTVSFIEGAAKVAVDFGLGAVEMARVVNVAWSGIKTVVLGTETAVVGIATTITATLAEVSKAGESLHIIPEGTSQKLQETADGLKDVTKGLAAETAEAAKGVVGHSEFDKTLDKLGGTLYNIRDAMDAASKSTEKQASATDIAENNARKLAATQDQLNQKMIDMEKVTQANEKSLAEISRVWNEYYELQAKHSVDFANAQEASIQRWFDDEVSKLDKSDKNWKAHYDALKAVADEKLKDIEVDWDTLQTKSIDYLQHQAEVAQNTYNEMIANAEHFTREALEEQRKKVEDTQNAVRGLGDEFQSAEAKAAKGAEEATAKLKEQTEQAEALAKQKNLDMGGSFEINKGNLASNLKTWGIPEQVGFAAAERGMSFQEILSAWQSGHIDDWKPAGPRIPGFKDGGTVMVGEAGPEVVRLPFGSQVYPTGVMPSDGGGGDSYHIPIYVNGTDTEIANKVTRALMAKLRTMKQFGAA